MKHYFSSLFVLLVILFGVSGTAVGQYSGTGTFEKISTLSEFTDGYYVIADQDSKSMMSATNDGKFFAHEPLSLTSVKVENPNTNNVWKVQFDGVKFTIFCEVTAQFVSYTGSSNEAYSVSAVTSDAQRWTATVANSVFSLKNVNTTTRLLQYNASSPRFACYKSSQKNIALYKLASATSTPSITPISPVDFGSQNINTTTSQSINVKGANLIGDLTVTVVGAGFSGSTTVTKADVEAGKDVTIAFLPTEIGPASGTATISGGGLTDVVVNLSGEGVSSTPALEPIAALDFGKVGVGASSSKNIVVHGRNLTGDLTVTVAGAGFSGSTTVTAAEAMATSGKTIAIAFDPTAGGAASGTVTISGGGLVADVVVTLTGVGSNAVAVFSEDFGGFTKGQPNSGASSSDVSSSLNNYTTLLGWTGSKVYEAGGSVKLGGSSALGWIQSPQMDLSANGGTFTVSFKAMGWSGDATSLFIYVNGVKTEVTGMSADADYTFTDFELTLTGGTSTTDIKFEGKQASKGRFFIDDLVISQEVGSSTPSITASDLSFGTVHINTSATKPLTVVGANLSDEITVVVAGEGFSTTTPTVAKEGGEASISFAGIAKGDYAGTVTLSNGATTVTYDMTASVIDPADYIVADIAALKDKGTTDKTSVFTLTGDVTFVFRNGRNIFVKDETGGLLIYDEIAPVITTDYSEGDIISGGIKGKIAEYGGLFEFIPTDNTAISTENNGSVTPESVSITTLKNNYATYEALLVNLSGVTFASGSFNTSSVTNIDISQGGETIACRNAFKTLDITPDPVANLRGFVTIFNSAIQIYPRDNFDIYTTVGCDPNEIADIKVISQEDGIVVDQVKEGDVIRVYGANGTEVARQIATGSRVSITLNKGFFVVKVGSASVKVVR